LFVFLIIFLFFCHHQGYQVNTHAIGDRANRIVIDAYESIINKRKNADLRLRIEHTQIVVSF